MAAEPSGAPLAEVVWTGRPPSDRWRPSHAIRPPVVAWAQSRPGGYRAEAEQVLRVMTRVARARPDVRLRLYDRRPGDDDGLLRRFRAADIRTEWVPNMNYKSYLASFDDVALGLAPVSDAAPFGRGKSFGKVLAYLDRHVPVIASDRADHGLFFTPGTGVVSNDEAVWTAELLRLLADCPGRQDMAFAGHRAFRKRLTSAVAAEQVFALAARAAVSRLRRGDPARLDLIPAE